jgi:hypothetical protein
MISRKFGCIFVHIPKCGGTSVESALFTRDERTEENLWRGFVDEYHNAYQTGGLQHLKAYQIRHFLGRAEYDKFFKFAVVRNPYGRAISQYNYMTSRRKGLRLFIDMDKEDDFSTYLAKIKTRSHVQWEPQLSFVNGFDGKRLVDKVIKLENLNEEWQALLADIKADSDTRLGHRNKIEAKFTRADLTAEHKEILQEYYYEDFVSFGYEF